MPEIRLRGGDVDGLSLHYLVEGRGPAVVLVHGLAGFGASWRHNIAPLAERATVYALDLPGFGRSAKPSGRYRLPDFARAVGGFMDALGLTQVSLVGHSLGGAVAVTVALMWPARVERLALVGAVVPGFDFRLSWLARFVAVHGVGEALALCGSRPLYRAALARCFYAPLREEVDFLVGHDYAPRTDFAARAAYLATLRGMRDDFGRQAADYRRAISTLDAPVLLIHGRQDRVVAPAHCVALGEMFRRVFVRWVDQCGHFPQIEHSRAVNTWLAEFLVGRTAPR